MKYNVRKNLTDSFSLLVKKPIILLPYFFIAFFEMLALELIFFSPRKPLAYLANPIVQKKFGETFVHYPGNLIVLPKLFYYAQILIYIFLGVLLAGICVSIVRNIQQGLPLKAKALIKSSLKNYGSFLVFGIVVSALMFFNRKLGGLLVTKAIMLIGKKLPPTVFEFVPYLSSVFIFFTNIILQTFLITTIPIMVLRKKVVWRGLWQGLVLGLRNFSAIFALIFLPFLMYLPLIVLKAGAPKLIGAIVPEVNLYIEVFGIIIAAFLECYVMVCVSRFVMEKDKLTSS